PTGRARTRTGPSPATTGHRPPTPTGRPADRATCDVDRGRSGRGPWSPPPCALSSTSSSSSSTAPEPEPGRWPVGERGGWPGGVSSPTWVVFPAGGRNLVRGRCAAAVCRAARGVVCPLLALHHHPRTPCRNPLAFGAVPPS